MRLAFACLLAVPAAAPAAERLAYAPVVEADTEVAGSESGGARLRYALLDRLEWAPQSGRDGYSWDFSALIGGDTDGIWLSSVGEGSLWGRPDYLEFQALYSRSLDHDFYLNAGLRWDAKPKPQRLYLAAGGQYDSDALWIGAFGYLSNKGEFSARLGGIYNGKLTDSLYLQPSFELNASAEDVPELGLGRGLSYAEAGLRLRFEAGRGFAPYVGLSWERALGRTARFARDAGEDPLAKSVVIGLRYYAGE
jgi:copper resistance protein B